MRTVKHAGIPDIAIRIGARSVSGKSDKSTEPMDVDAIEVDEDQCMKCGRKEGHMSGQCPNGAPKCGRCYHRHWVVDSCQEYKEKMAARECYTCGEKGHVAKKCKKPAGNKQKRKDNDVLALEDVCYTPPEDRDFENERPVPGQYYAETLEDYCYAPQHVGSEAEWPAP